MNYKHYMIRLLPFSRSLFTQLKFPTILLPPKPPDSSQCCGDGCNNCVYIEYFDKQIEFQKLIKDKLVFKKYKKLYTNDRDLYQTYLDIIHGRYL